MIFLDSPGLASSGKSQILLKYSRSIQGSLSKIAKGEREKLYSIDMDEADVEGIHCQTICHDIVL